MKAWILHGNNDIKLNDVPIPMLKDGEVLVQVKAVGICTSDVPRVYEKGAYHYPIILGHEFSGITSGGRRVGVFPLIPCHICDSCQTGHYETCSDYSYIGSRQDGAYAEYVAVPEWNLIDLPKSVTFEQAALLEPAAVAFHAVKRMQSHSITNAAVIGNGVIGNLIGVWLMQYGIQIVDVLGRNDNNTYSNYDVCIEAAGTSESFRRCVELTCPNGEILLVGNPDNNFNIDQKLYWQILRKQVTVNGVWNSSYPSEWQQVLEHADKIQLDRFISHIYEFNELDKAFEMIHGKKEKHSKVMVKF